MAIGQKAAESHSLISSLDTKLCTENSTSMILYSDYIYFVIAKLFDFQVSLLRYFVVHI